MTHLTSLPAAFLTRGLLRVAGMKVLLAFPLVASSTTAEPPIAYLIPAPASARPLAGDGFPIATAAVIVADPSLASIASGLASALERTTNQTPRIVAAAPSAGPRIRLVLRAEPAESVAGAYRLSIGANEIVAEAGAPEGLFHAVQTLRQLLAATADGRSTTLPPVEIVDAPRFRWRGLLVDVAGHFHGPAALRQIVDQLAYYKMNVLQLHLTDYGGWRVEVPSYPRLTSVGGRGNLETPGIGEPQFLTQAELRELVAYAAERFVTIAPIVEMPGHAGAAARAYPEFFTRDGTFNPAAPGVYDFIATIVAEVGRQFPGRVFHFAGDEVNTGSWSQLPEVAAFMKAEGLKTHAELQRYFYNRVAQIIRSAGRQPMAWDETAEAGVHSGVTIQWWRKARPDVRDAALARGVEMVLSPVDQVYLDYAAGPGEPGAPWEGNDNGPTSVEKILRWEPLDGIPPSVRPEQIAGIEAALWTQFMRSESFLQFMLYPRLLAVAEVAWRPRGERDPAEFQRRLAPHLARLRAEHINVRSSSNDATPYLIH